MIPSRINRQKKGDKSIDTLNFNLMVDRANGGAKTEFDPEFFHSMNGEGMRNVTLDTDSILTSDQLEDIEELTEDQFKVYEAREPQDIIVLSSTYGGTMVDNTGDIQWPGTPPTPPLANLTPSNPFSLEYDNVTEIWAQHFYNPPNPYSNVVALLPGETPTGDLNQLLATITVGTDGQITQFVSEYVKPDGGFGITWELAPPIIGFLMSGGVWQTVDGIETTVYEPEDEDILWNAITDHDGVFSKVYDMTAASGAVVVWAKLDRNASPDTTFTFIVLDDGVDPTWADGETYLKIATMSFLYETDGDDTTPVIETVIEQHHMGGIHETPFDGTACASMTSNAVTSSTGVVPFGVLNHETNDSILDVDLANNKIIVKEGLSGIYGIKMQAQLLIELADSPGTATIVAVVRKDGSYTECQADMYIYKPTVDATEQFANQFSASIDEFVDASSGDVDLDVYVSISVDGSDAASLQYCRLDVSLKQLVDSAT